ncbi:MAG: sodium:calcium antiporter, partial [Planctomycetota bacterium]
NIVGSNIANVGLILGVTGLVCALKVHSRVINKELPWLIVISLAVVAMAWVVFEAGEVSRIDGLLLLAGFVMFLVGWARMGQEDRADTLVTDLGEEAAEEAQRAIGPAIGLFLVGLACLLVGGKLTERGAVSLATLLGFSESLIGLTVVAMATSLPELATGVIAARRGHPDLAVGNVVGSNVFNLLFVMGVTATVSPIPVPHWGFYDLGVMTILTVLLLVFARTRRGISRVEALILLALYVGYITWTVMREM